LRATVSATTTSQDSPAAAVTLSPTDLPRLCVLREAVRALVLGHEAAAVPSQTVELELRGGAVTYRATGAGWRVVAALVHTELLLAQHTGALERFRNCANPACGAAFTTAPATAAACGMTPGRAAAS
jgi:hypothetical protein